jgi:hypothetical protein
MTKAEFIIEKVSSLTSNIVIASASKEKPIELTEFDSEHIKLYLSKRMGRGLLVALDTQVVLGSQTHNMAATGKVSQCEETSDGGFMVVIELHEYNHDIWTAFLTLQRNEQSRVEELMKRIKGIE